MKNCTFIARYIIGESWNHYPIPIGESFYLTFIKKKCLHCKWVKNDDRDQQQIWKREFSFWDSSISHRLFIYEPIELYQFTSLIKYLKFIKKEEYNTR